MDALRQQAHNVFCNHRIFSFKPSASPFETVQITQHSEDHTKFSLDSVSEDQLREIFNQSSNNDATQSTFKLLTIVRSEYLVLEIGKSLFEDLIEACEIDKNFYRPLAYEQYGFQKARSYISGPGSGYVDSYYLNTTSALLLWSYDSTQRRTCAIFIPNHVGTIPDSAGAKEAAMGALESQIALVDTPHLMLLVGAIVNAAWLRESLQNSLYMTREIDKRTEQGMWRVPGRKPAELDELVEGAKLVGYTLTRLENMDRQRQVLSDMLSLFTPEGGSCYRPGVSTEEEAETALCAVKSQIDLEKIQIDFLLARLRTQQSVIFNLINQKHTKTSLETATQARNDSASMKMLALIATVFLPGTSFSTLFAVPSLRWEESIVISHRFWIYLAFVVPSTVVLLLGYWFAVSRSKRVARFRESRYYDMEQGPCEVER
ncbi:uncharacterized protein EI97DRAFT_435197 [Westerdykella ornata]|uniref:Cora-domain-containing protein n=1 Tax=Westerdykella ornata TaxID=318751 RepID=A0A6A6JED2_WESOR|nr:uncharacterized protein EI97DRAFT_435197 [Westerdykella ornata]KAF2274358.1 hypothetical protein EI97DRAFT_435197 [Westerdykella ornata]